MAVEWSALLALAVIWVWQPKERTRRRFLRLAVALWGTTAFGIFHQMLAYMIMVGFSERDWDEPPGTGYLTVAMITISAILIAILTLRAPHRRAEDERRRLHDQIRDDPSVTTKALLITGATAFAIFCALATTWMLMNLYYEVLEFVMTAWFD